MNAFTQASVARQRAIYEGMCKGKIAQRGIHKMRKGKRVAPIIGGGYPYHGHVSFD